jgi:hypothetical protein
MLSLLLKTNTFLVPVLPWEFLIFIDEMPKIDGLNHKMAEVFSILLTLGLCNTEIVDSRSGQSLLKHVLFIALKRLTPEIIVTNLTIPRQMIFVEKFVSGFPAFEAFTMFGDARNLTPSSSGGIRSTVSHPVSSKSILIVFYLRLDLRSDSFGSRKSMIQFCMKTKINIPFETVEREKSSL